MSIYFGKELKEFRKQHGLTQKQLAEIMFTVQSAIPKYETNECKFPIELIIAIAKHPQYKLIAYDYINKQSEMIDAATGRCE